MHSRNDKVEKGREEGKGAVGAANVRKGDHSIAKCLSDRRTVKFGVYLSDRALKEQSN